MYRMPDNHDDYAILLPNGKIKRGMVGSQGYPIAPDGHWTWLKTKKRRIQEREEKKQRQRRPASENGTITVLPPTTCVDCPADLRTKKHYHTTTRDEGYGAVDICCRCAWRRGYRCVIRARMLKRKKARKNADH